MRVKTSKRVWTLIMIVAMLFGTSFSALGLEKGETDNATGVFYDTEEKVSSISAITALNKLPLELKTDIGESFLSKGITPLKIEEESSDLSSITTINSDGTKTLFMFDAPVKYIDSDTGEIKYIDNSIVESSEKGYALENKANDVKVQMPEKIGSGVLLTYGDYSLSMQPNRATLVEIIPIETEENSEMEESTENDTSDESEHLTPEESFSFEKSKEIEADKLISKETKSMAAKKETGYKLIVNKNNGVNEKVEYESVFGEGISLSYSMVNRGIKEDIIIESYTGANRFEYIVDAGELQAELSEDGRILTFVNHNSESIWEFDAIWAMDSNNEVTYNCLYEVEEKQDGSWLVTVALNENPIENSPFALTLSVTQVTFGNDLMTQKYFSSSVPSGDETETVIGMGSLLNVVFTEQGFGKFLHINHNNIISADYYFRYESYGFWYADCSVNMSIYKYNKNISSSPTYSSMMNTSNRQYYGVASLRYGTYVQQSFSAKKILSEWISDYVTNTGDYYKNGFILMTDQINPKKVDFYTSRNSNALKRPYIVVNYNEDNSLQDGIYYLSEYNNGNFVTVPNSSSSSDLIREEYSESVNQEFYISKVSNGNYSIKSLATDLYVSPITITNNSNVKANYALNTFKIISNGDGSYRIIKISNDSNYYLYASDNNNKIKMWNCGDWGSDAKNKFRWKIETPEIYNLKTNPTAYPDNNYDEDDDMTDVYKNESTISIIARVLYSENNYGQHLYMHAWIVHNLYLRDKNPTKGLREVVLTANCWQGLTGLAALNPKHPSKWNASVWFECVDVASKIVNGDMSVIPKYGISEGIQDATMLCSNEATAIAKNKSNSVIVANAYNGEVTLYYKY